MHIQKTHVVLAFRHLQGCTDTESPKSLKSSRNKMLLIFLVCILVKVVLVSCLNSSSKSNFSRHRVNNVKVQV